MAAVGAVVGGMIPQVLDKYILPASTSETTKSVVAGVAGAMLQVFAKGDLLSSAGAGMLGVAGQKLSESLLSKTSTSGVGLLPGQQAIMGVGRPLPRVTAGNRTWTSSNLQNKEQKKANVI